ncbi:MAG: SMP-30/gluconolactonase/LRE family protein [Bacteroidota bacterium]
MKHFFIPFSLLCLLTIACQPETQTQSDAQVSAEAPKTVGEIEQNSPALTQWVSPQAQMEVLSEGHVWTEGPVWVPEIQSVLFSDIPPNSIFQWKEGEGSKLYLKPSGYTGTVERGGEGGSNGLLLDKDGSLILCQHGDRRVAKMVAPLSEPSAKFVSVVKGWEGKRFNSPNDAAFHPNGMLYFTDPPYGLEKRMEDPNKEIDFQGVYRVDASGEVHLLTDQLTRPNGIAFSPEGDIAYVANSDPERAIWMAYEVNEAGDFENGKVFFDATSMTADKKGLPDGLKVNAQGILFATGPGGVLIFTPEGEHLGTLFTGQATSNCAFGEDEKTLYITADMYLLRIALL